jgi:uncharacterized protein
MLNDQISEDLKNAMKNKEEKTLSAVRMLKAAMQLKMIDKKVKILADEDILDIIQKQVKQRKDSIVEFQKGGRQDLIDKEQGEINILQKYLPQQMSYEEIKKITQEVIAATGATSKADIGKVMKELMPKVKGKADGREVNKAVSELLP